VAKDENDRLTGHLFKAVGAPKTSPLNRKGQLRQAQASAREAKLEAGLVERKWWVSPLVSDVLKEYKKAHKLDSVGAVLEGLLSGSITIEPGLMSSKE